MSENGQNQIAVEEGASPELLASVRAFSKELSGSEADEFTTVANPDIKQEEPVEDINLDAPVEPKKEEPKPDAKDDKEPAKDDGEDGGETTPETPSAPIKVMFRGKERELSANDIVAALGRAEASQKKADTLSKSDEYKLGVIMKAAQEGDKGAQKKLQKMLVDFTGAEDVDGMIDNLEDINDEFDENAKLNEQADKDKWDEAFSDVSEGVDYKKNLDIVETDLRARILAKVYDEFWGRPDTRRTMYNLVATGQMSEIMDMFDQNLAKLPFKEQLDIERDPDQWGSLFTKTVRERNASLANRGSAGGQSDSNTDDGSKTKSRSAVSSVSSGTRGRNPQNAQDGEPDFYELAKDPAKFDEWKRKNGLPV
jgi:hypothetical protein